MKDDKVYLIHILECIARIEQYTSSGQTTFLSETMVHDAVLRNLHTLAESSQHISITIKQQYTEVPWGVISAFRNVIVHDYLGIDLKRVWDTIRNDLPLLKKQMQTILADLNLNLRYSE